MVYGAVIRRPSPSPALALMAFIKQKTASALAVTKEKAHGPRNARVLCNQLRNREEN